MTTRIPEGAGLVEITYDTPVQLRSANDVASDLIELVGLQDRLLLCYRMNRRPSDSVLDKIIVLRDQLKDVLS